MMLQTFSPDPISIVTPWFPQTQITEKGDFSVKVWDAITG
eukprot:CAMPEP_0171424642 /NCGR_PEP_ID=MMETSP0881-20121228/2818_1 /TAXON_ID=67004 /ORGANISM="Thalassiosira weissflogii, Strain CCMP1336" /LENGTH=39 /DNA_ID= /DNA_START= /DNA_END= /DNA_ORIENTATION=